MRGREVGRHPIRRSPASNPTTGQENPLPYTPIETSDIDPATNRFTSGTGTAYNDNGQVVTDNKFRALGYAYDANGRMVLSSQANTPDAVSVYDALGNRVAEKVNDVWQFVIYDAFGKIVAEYGGATPQDEGGVKYFMQDWQGSVRAGVNAGGFVKSRTDHQAFGEDIASGVGLRSEAQGFGAPAGTRQGYGLTENDQATGLNHTWFRKNENRAGRWTSPDPYNGSASVGDPQSWNRYAYVENEPTNSVDPSGLTETPHWYVTIQISWFDRIWDEHFDVSISGIDDRLPPTTGDPGLPGGDPGIGANDSAGPQPIPANCRRFLDALGITKRVEALLKSTTLFVDVNINGSKLAKNFVGKDAASATQTLGDWFDSRGPGAYTRRRGKATKIFFRNMTPLLKLHEVVHAAFPSSLPTGTSNLDELFGNAIKLERKPGETWSDAVSRFFNSECGDLKPSGNPPAVSTGGH